MTGVYRVTLLNSFSVAGVPPNMLFRALGANPDGGRSSVSTKETKKWDLLSPWLVKKISPMLNRHLRTFSS